MVIFLNFLLKHLVYVKDPYDILKVDLDKMDNGNLTFSSRMMI
jgi:hypothetical protein